MSEGQKQDPNYIHDPNEVTPLIDKKIDYTPLGEKESIKVSVGMVRLFLTRPTKQGFLPSDQDIIKFMMLCKARELNPWVGDAFLVGYDTDEGPEFNLITSVQALLKRADLTPRYRGHDAGVILKKEDCDQLLYRSGSIVMQDEVLVGGWCVVYSEDRKDLRTELNLATYRERGPRWKKDPAGMIRKCAIAGGLREAFPNQVGGLYVQEERDSGNLPALPQTPPRDASEDGPPLPPGQTEQVSVDTILNRPVQETIDSANSPETPPEKREPEKQEKSPPKQGSPKQSLPKEDPPKKTVEKEAQPETAADTQGQLDLGGDEELAGDTVEGNAEPDPWWSGWQVPKIEGGGTEPDEFIDPNAMAYLDDCTKIGSVDEWESKCKEIGMQGEAVKFFADQKRETIRAARNAPANAG